MKKIILAALILSGTLASNAQKIELGLNGGLAPYIWADKTFKNYPGTTKYKPGYYGAFKTGLILGGWQVGVGAEMFQTRIEAINTIRTPNDFKNVTTFQTLMPFIFANKLIRLPKSFLYAGINGGYTTGTEKAVIDFPMSPVYNSSVKYSGLSGGVQLGFTINLVKGLGANAEAGAKYVQMSRGAIFGSKGSSYYHLVFPVSLGVRYTL